MKASSVVTNMALAVVYSVTYVACYLYFLSYHFDYLGYEVNSQDAGLLTLSLLMCVVPVLCYRGVRAISSVLSVVIYIMLYVPIILTFALSSKQPPLEVVLIQVTFMAGMALLFLADVILLKNPFDIRSNIDLMRWVLPVTVVSTLYILLLYRSNLRFVSFDEAVYEQRFANQDIGTDFLTRYLSAWLTNVFIPLCLANGLSSRSKRYFAVGTAACLALYMATAAKSTMLFPFVYSAAFVLLGGRRLNAIYPLVIGSLTAMTAILMTNRTTEGVAFLVSALVLMRTIGNGGQLTVQYYDFFLSHPHTSYTHINIVGALTGAYPYGDLGVGQAVGQFYWSMDMNANASFWATDGIAAFGLIGVIFASVACALLFVIMNSLTRGYNQLFVLLCFVPFLVGLMNASLFSAIWSGGALFLLLFFAFNRRAPAPIVSGRAPAGSPMLA